MELLCVLAAVAALFCGCTVLYIQTLDDIFVQSYADLFTDKLAAAQSGETLLYRVTDAGFAPMPMEVSAQ